MAENDPFELTEAVKHRLIESALEAQANAYCPYSNFAVGAAVVTPDGSIFKGCNVENASYGLTICAERTAVTAAVTAGHLNLKAIAIVTSAPSAARPCGACRQVICEFSNEDSPTIVVCRSLAGEETVETINDLLPNRFNLL